MKNKIEYLIFITFSYLVKFLGLNNSRKAAIFLAALFFYIIPLRKEVVFKNLRIAFPELNENGIKNLGFQTYKSIAITLIEILYLPFITDEVLINSVKITNPELLISKHKDGKGLILLSAHFGNWEYLAASAALNIGIPFSVVVKDQSNKQVSDWMNKFRTRWNNKVVSLGISIRNIVVELTRKNVVAIVADQRGPIEGLRASFFNRPSAIYAGPAQLAIKLNSPMLYGLAVRQPDYSYKCTLVEIKTDDLTGSEEEKILQLCQKQFDHLESVIKKHPEQYFWMHNRWKY